MKVSELNENLFTRIKQKAKEIWNGVDIDNLTTEEIAQKSKELAQNVTNEINKNKMFNAVLPYNKSEDSLGKKLDKTEIDKIKKQTRKGIDQLYRDAMGGQLELLNYKPSYLAAKIFINAGKDLGYDDISFQETPFDRFLYNIGTKIL